MCNNCVENVIASKHEQEGSQNFEQNTETVNQGYCPLCNEPVEENNINECRKNTKLINFMTSEEAFPLLLGSFDSIPCVKHP